MFAAIKALLIALPELIDLIKSGIKSFNEWVQLQKDMALLERERLASEKAVTTKDTTELEDIFRGKP